MQRSVEQTKISDDPTRPVIAELRSVLGGVIRGKPEAIELLLIGFLAEGHVLLEDVPGVGKTTLAKALARAVSLDFSRLSFTPDLLPADVLGVQLLDPSSGKLSFQPGPIFTHLLLADEINRASPRTQSALLEGMNELQVTVEGATHVLPGPFMVLATQNPVDFQGTYPLPEAQLDRFLMSFGLGYPPPDEELLVLLGRQRCDPLDAICPVASREVVLRMQKQVRDIHVEREVGRYLVELLGATRRHPRIDLGVSTRGGLAWFRASQARAYVAGRDYLSPDDVQALAVPVLAHRLICTADTGYAGLSRARLVEEILSDVSVPA